MREIKMDATDGFYDVAAKTSRQKVIKEITESDIGGVTAVGNFRTFDGHLLPTVRLNQHA